LGVDNFAVLFCIFKELDMTNRTANHRRVLFLKLSTILLAVCLTLALSSAPSQVTFAQATTAQATPPAQTTSSILAPLALSPIEKAEKDGTLLRLSLKDLTKLALQNNLDIAISDTNEEIQQQRLIQAYGPYDPMITSRLGVSSTKAPNTNQTNIASGQQSFNKQDYSNWNFGFSQAVKTGGTLQASWNSSRTDTNQLFSLFTPQYSAQASVQFTQPLRRNFRIDQNRTNIKLVNMDMKINDSKFKQQVVTTIAGIQGVYWDLVSAIRAYDIARESVRLAQITLRDNRKKVEIGTLAPIAITEARATMASREGDLISAEQGIFQVENALLSKISNDRNAEIWHKVIAPVDTPEFKDFKISLDDAIDTALKNRPELEQIDLGLRETDLNYDMMANLKKWQFDLTGGFGTVGVAGPQSISPSTGVPQIVPSLVGGLPTAYKTIFSGGYTNWSVAFNIQIPLRNRSVDAQLAQLKVNQRQSLMARKNQELAIQVDVRNAVQALDTNKKRIDQARLARELAAEQLDGEEKRFQAGLSQNYLVLQRQNDLSVAQYQELQALISYRKSIITLQQSIYTLLESNDFEIAKTSSDNVPALK
jgi:HAE1 family hydrophobic/amphiphilic exporter-1